MAQTQEEVDNLIETLIIDNTTGLVDPARVRQALKAINARVPVSSDPSTLTANAPLSIDEFSSTLSISQANESVSGYINNLDFKKFNMGTQGVPAGDFRLALKGYQSGIINTGEWPTIELNDICLSFRPTSDIAGAGDFGFFQYVDAEKDDQDPTAYMPVMISAVNVT